MKTHYTEDTTIQAVHTLFAKLASLRSLTGNDIATPEGQKSYKRTVEETYATIVFLEKAFDHLATELEYQQERLNQCLDISSDFIKSHLLWTAEIIYPAAEINVFFILQIPIIRMKV